MSSQELSRGQKFVILVLPRASSLCIVICESQLHSQGGLGEDVGVLSISLVDC